MDQWSKSEKQIIDAHINDFYSSTYDSYMKKVGGFDKYVQSLGGVFTECHNKTELVKTVSEFRKRTNYVQGLMAIWKFCYWNGKTWWYYLNKAAKSFYRTKQTKSCPSGTIVQLCTGAGNRTRITNCNYGVDTLSKALGKPIWSRGYTSMVKNGATVVRDKSKLKVGDLVHFFTKVITTSNTERWDNYGWHHVAIVYEITDTDIWLADFGSRFIKTGNPLHKMSKTGTVPGGEYSNYGGWSGIHFLDLVDDTEVVPMLNGIDVASYQQGINFSRVPCDFAIIKATEGVDYVNPACNAQYASAKDAGKLRGLYHYASGGDAEAEAKYFIDNIRNYVGSAILILDWESYGNSAFGKTDVAWCKRWLDKVYALTGVRPMIYMSQSVVLAHDWSSVAKEYGLWLAQYVVDARSGYKQDYTHGSTGAWQYPAIWQYTSGGYLSGWVGKLDLDIAYMDKEAWGKYAEVKKEKEEVVPVPRTIKLGSTGKVVRIWQAFLGFTGDDIDGKFGAKETLPATKKWQKAHGLRDDGVVGPKTWRKALESIE